MLPSYYEFHNPVKIISGKKALDNLPSELEAIGATRPLVITDQGVSDAGLVKTVTQSFSDSGITLGALFDDVPADSSCSVVVRVADIFRKNSCDCLVAVGGGSVIDTAKGVNILVTENSSDLLAFAGAEILSRPLKPLVVVPTTSGTGSEVTNVAVISDVDRNVKMAFVSPFLLPTLAVLDPRMTLSLPPKMTASTGMDALTHAIEGYVCLQHNPLSDAYATAAIELIRKNLVSAVQEPDDAGVRLAMANASTLAGASFSNSMVGMVHSLGHAVGGICHVPHGIAMGIFLPFGLEYNLAKCETRIARLLLPMAGAEIYSRTPESRRARTMINAVRDFQKTLKDLCGLPLTLKELDIQPSKFDAIAQAAVNDPSLIFNPREMDRNDALTILEQAYQ